MNRKMFYVALIVLFSSPFASADVEGDTPERPPAAAVLSVTEYLNRLVYNGSVQDAIGTVPIQLLHGLSKNGGFTVFTREEGNCVITWRDPENRFVKHQAFGADQNMNCQKVKELKNSRITRGKIREYPWLCFSMFGKDDLAAQLRERRLRRGGLLNFYLSRNNRFNRSHFLAALFQS